MIVAAQQVQAEGVMAKLVMDLRDLETKCLAAVYDSWPVLKKNSFTKEKETMSDQRTTFQSRAIQAGFWSSVIIAALFIVFTICFVAIVMSPPLFTWTNVSDYQVYVKGSSQVFQQLARLTMLLFGPAFIVLLNSIHEVVPTDQKFLVRVSICFGVIFTVLISINYFVQLTAIRLNLSNGGTEGLEQFLQANPLSVMSSINLLGWTLFLGLSSLFVTPVFSGSRLEKSIAILFALNGVVCLLGGVGYAFQNEGLVSITLNFGMGGAILMVSIALCVFFKRLQHKPSIKNLDPLNRQLENPIT